MYYYYEILRYVLIQLGDFHQSPLPKECRLIRGLFACLGMHHVYAIVAGCRERIEGTLEI